MYVAIRRDVGEICAVLGCKAAGKNNSLSKFRNKLTSRDILSRNVGKELPLYVA